MEFDPKVFDSLKYWQHFQFAASKSHCLDANEEASVAGNLCDQGRALPCYIHASAEFSEPRVLTRHGSQPFS